MWRQDTDTGRVDRLPRDAGGVGYVTLFGRTLIQDVGQCRAANII